MTYGVSRVHGYIQQGVWFSKDIRFVEVSATGATFLTDLVTDNSVSAQMTEAVNSGLEQVVELMEQRGTVLGISVVDATHVWLMVGYASGAFDDATVITALEAQVNAISGYSAAAVTVETGFAGAALGVAV